VKIEIEKIQVLNEFYIYGDFDLELPKLKLKMMTNFFCLFGPFLTFLSLSFLD
jgi:hypothetical protein